MILISAPYRTASIPIKPTQEKAMSTNHTPTPPLRRACVAAMTLGVSFLLQGNALSQTLLLEYKFNETGVQVTDSSSTGANSHYYYSSSTQQDMSSDDGLGVSGKSGDRAFHTLRRTAGSGYTGGAVNSGTAIAAINGLQSFTIMGWFNTGDAEMIASGARLLSFASATGGIDLWATTNGRLNLTVNGTAATSSELYGGANSWVFFAVTYDGTASSNNVSFYVGDTTEGSLSEGYLRSLNKGTVQTTTNSLMIGNRAGYDRPFNGYIDNIRIFGSTSDGNGALSAAEIENYRAVDAIPEASSLAFMLTGGLGIFAAMKARSKKQ